MELKQLLEHVGEYVREQQQQRHWQPGDTIHYAGPYFDDAEIVAAAETLLKGWLVMGKDCLRFEQKFPALLGKRHGVLTNSGSSANLLMMNALRSKRGHNLPAGTRVLTPVAGFPTTVNPLLQVGFEPVFVDIEPETLNLDLDQVEAALAADPNIRVITFAHVLGNPPNMERLMELVNRHNLILLEDCCDALGSTYAGQPLGSFGVMASCSFYPAHHMTMGEGGFVACNDKVTEDIVRSFREWGRGCYCVGPEANKLKCGTCKRRFSNWIPSMPNEIFDHKYVYDEIGYNLKPMELQASMGLQQLDKLEEIGRRRRHNFSRLYQIFKPYEQFFQLPVRQPNSDPDWFAFALTLRTGTPFKRSDIVDWLESHGVQTRPYFAGNIMLQPAYDHLPWAENARERFPVASHVTTHTFFLGTSPVITDPQLDYIGELVQEFMQTLVQEFMQTYTANL